MSTVGHPKLEEEGRFVFLANYDYLSPVNKEYYCKYFAVYFPSSWKSRQWINQSNDCTQNAVCPVLTLRKTESINTNRWKVFCFHVSECISKVATVIATLSPLQASESATLLEASLNYSERAWPMCTCGVTHFPLSPFLRPVGSSSPPLLFLPLLVISLSFW